MTLENFSENVRKQVFHRICNAGTIRPWLSILGEHCSKNNKKRTAFKSEFQVFQPLAWHRLNFNDILDKMTIFLPIVRNNCKKKIHTEIRVVYLVVSTHLKICSSNWIMKPQVSGWNLKKYLKLPTTKLFSRYAPQKTGSTRWSRSKMWPK